MVYTCREIPKYFFLLCAFCHTFLLFSQDTENSLAEKHELWPHSIGLMVGYSWIPETIDEMGKTYVKVNPAIGLDYAYFLSEKWGFGLVNDFEVSRYVVEDKNGDYLERENKLISALTVIYESSPAFGLFVGPGYEFERHLSFPIIKAGFEVTKRFEEGWGVGFNASIDLSEYYETISAGIMVFKRFPR